MLNDQFLLSFDRCFNLVFVDRVQLLDLAQRLVLVLEVSQQVFFDHFRAVADRAFLSELQDFLGDVLQLLLQAVIVPYYALVALKQLRAFLLQG